jgi:hypothetical protein
MPYQLRLKIYTNENLPKGSNVLPYDPVNETFSPLLHCHPDDYVAILKLIAEYYRREIKKQYRRAEGERRRANKKDEHVTAQEENHQ